AFMILCCTAHSTTLQPPARQATLPTRSAVSPESGTFSLRRFKECNAIECNYTPLDGVSVGQRWEDRAQDTSVSFSCQELDGVGVFGVVEGGDILEERVRSARETAKRPVAGFCLDGFQTGAMDQALRSQLITAVTKELPEDKPRLLQGVGRPDEVLACVEAGVDLFEGFLPFQTTERGCALCFSFDVTLDPESAGTATLTGVVKSYEASSLWWLKLIRFASLIIISLFSRDKSPN
ncbi:hypothetical protein XENOCAPTIV_006405, partial [Xenoophorus captivus]